MIFSFVSPKSKAGKSHAAKVMEDHDWISYTSIQLTGVLYHAAEAFLSDYSVKDKYEKHDQLGIALKELVNAIAEKVESINPDITTHRVMEHIDHALMCKMHVLVHDTRRQRDFNKLDEIAKRHGTHHYLIEITPVGKQADGSVPDTWTNGLEPCGYEVWRYRHRYYLENDGTEQFDRDVIELVERIIGDTL